VKFKSNRVTLFLPYTWQRFPAKNSIITAEFQLTFALKKINYSILRKIKNANYPVTGHIVSTGGRQFNLVISPLFQELLFLYNIIYLRTNEPDDKHEVHRLLDRWKWSFQLI
jgi:hypothetical protein